MPHPHALRLTIQPKCPPPCSYWAIPGLTRDQLRAWVQERAKYQQPADENDFVYGPYRSATSKKRPVW